jgi:hypothetical protein
LPEDSDDLVVSGVLIGDEREGVVGLVEDLEGRWWNCGASGISDQRLFA